MDPGLNIVFHFKTDIQCVFHVPSLHTVADCHKAACNRVVVAGFLRFVVFDQSHARLSRPLAVQSLPQPGTKTALFDVCVLPFDERGRET